MVRAAAEDEEMLRKRPMRQGDVFRRKGLAFVLVVIATVGIGPLGLFSSAQVPEAHFVGSASCKACHAQAYNGWKQTRMANVIRDPKQHPEAVLGDFTRPDPLRPFTLDQVAFVYGSRWKQRYFTRRGDDYFPLPAQWDIKGSRWLPYHVEAGTDWWLPFYGPTNFDRPTGPTCDGCHSVNYNVETKQVTEWNVGCEKCHGPGSLHVEHPTKKNIVNPETLDPVRGNDTCIQCHSQGRPTPESDPRAVLRLARRLPARRPARRLLAPRRSQARHHQLLPIRRSHRP